MPDFKLGLTWQCNSNFIPFLKHFVPSSSYEIIKVNSQLRIDSKEKSKQAQYSLIINGNDKDLKIVDHQQKQIYDFWNVCYIEDVDQLTQLYCSQDIISEELNIQGYSENKSKQQKSEQITIEKTKYKLTERKIQLNCEGYNLQRNNSIDKAQNLNMTFAQWENRDIKSQQQSFQGLNFFKKQLNISVKEVSNYKITTANLLKIAKHLAILNQNFNKIVQILNILDQNSFPLEFKIPISFSIEGKISFTDFTTTSVISPSYFRLDQTYTEISFYEEAGEEDDDEDENLQQTDRFSDIEDEGSISDLPDNNDQSLFNIKPISTRTQTDLDDGINNFLSSKRQYSSFGDDSSIFNQHKLLTHQQNFERDSTVFSIFKMNQSPSQQIHTEQSPDRRVQFQALDLFKNQSYNELMQRFNRARNISKHSNQKSSRLAKSTGKKVIDADIMYNNL